MCFVELLVARRLLTFFVLNDDLGSLLFCDLIFSRNISIDFLIIISLNLMKKWLAVFILFALKLRAQEDFDDDDNDLDNNDNGEFIDTPAEPEQP